MFCSNPPQILIFPCRYQVKRFREDISFPLSLKGHVVALLAKLVECMYWLSCCRHVRWLWSPTLRRRISPPGLWYIPECPSPKQLTHFHRQLSIRAAQTVFTKCMHVCTHSRMHSGRKNE